MKITGRKIVVLTPEERDALTEAMAILDSLDDELGSDEFYDFKEISELLYYIRSTDKFEIEFKGEE